MTKECARLHKSAQECARVHKSVIKCFAPKLIVIFEMTI